MSIVRSFFIITMMWLFATGAILSGNVQLVVNQTTVPKGEGVTVSLIAQGQNVRFPTITDIDGVPVEKPRISQKVEASYINGTFKSIRQKTMQFTFYPDHNVTIPPLRVEVDGKTEQTQPVTIQVRPPSHAASTQGGYQLRMEASRDQLYVGEAFLLQVIFFEPRTSAVAQAQYIPPKFDGFFVKSAPKERLEQTPEGTAHVFDYILTPQKAGTFTITAPQIKLGIQTFSGTRDPWGFFNDEVQWKSLKATPKTVTVKPLPVSADLVGDFTLKSSVDTTQAKPNKPVSYTLTLEGTGGLDELDEPTFDLPDVTVYSDEAQSTTQVVNGTIQSRWTKHYTFIADHSFTIPAVTLKVFDPKSGKSRTISTQPVTIQITGSRAKQTTPQPPAPQAARSAQSTPPPAATTTAPHNDHNRSLFDDPAYYAQKTKQSAAKKWPAWALVLSFILGVALTLLAGWIRTRWLGGGRKRFKRKYSTAEALEILYPHTNDSPEIEAMVRRLYRIQNGEKGLTVDPDELQWMIHKVEKAQGKG